MEIVIKSLDTCQKRVLPQDPLHNVELICECFGELKSQFPDLFESHKLSFFAFNFAQPHFSELADKADFFSSDLPFSHTMSNWKDLLHEEAQAPPQQLLFHRLTFSLFTPQISEHVANQWNVTQPESLLSLIEFWQKVWPTSFTHFVLEKLIFPKIKFAVHNWEPTSSPTPIHLWLHHWLPYLESSLESLYAQISYKMAAALLRWDPRDVSAYKLIHPWHKLMPSSVFEPILSRIVAKLGIFLSKSLHLSKSEPSREELKVIELVLIWSDMVAHSEMASLLEKNFFHSFYAHLFTWIRQEGKPCYATVAKFYQKWKSSFSPISSSSLVEKLFDHSLEVINALISGIIKFNPIPASSLVSKKVQEKTHKKAAQEVDDSDLMSLKSVVERFAADNNVILLPTNKRVNGREVLSFGGKLIYVESDLVYYSEKGSWKPVSLENLLQLAKTSSTGSVD